MSCNGCAVECWDFPSCPPLVSRETLAEAEAGDLAYAGQVHDLPPGPPMTDEVRRLNEYGSGTLF